MSDNEKKIIYFVVFLGDIAIFLFSVNFSKIETNIKLKTIIHYFVKLYIKEFMTYILYIMIII